MGGKRRQFTAEFKLEAVRLASEREKPLSEVVRELGIRPGMLRTWKRQAESRAGLMPGDVFPGNGRLSSQEEEIRTLRRELEQVKQERDFLKKRRLDSREGVAVKYACIEAQRGTFPILLMCRVPGVSRSGFYAAQQRGFRKCERADQRLRVEIRSIHRMSRRRYGSPRVHQELRAHGIWCGRKRVERLMREDGLQAKKKRRFRRTTDSAHVYPIAPNLLDRRFAVAQMEGLNQVWVGDITYVPTRQGWLYLAVVLDLKSRAVVGWAMKDTLDTSLATDALTMALGRRGPGRDLLHHSDRGVQYASGDYQEILRANGITCSMSRRGDCYDNAVAESFFATLEWELIEDSDWHTHQEAKRDLFEYLEIWYNRQRRHSALGYQSPAEYEAQLALTRRAA